MIEDKIKPATSFTYELEASYLIKFALSICHSNKVDGITNDLQFFFANDKRLKKVIFFRDVVNDGLDKLSIREKKVFDRKIKDLLCEALKIDGKTPGFVNMSDFCRVGMVKKLKEMGYESK